jgi:hypothetical protein
VMPQSLKQKRICSPKLLLRALSSPVFHYRIPNVLRKNNLDTTQASQKGPKQQGQKSAEMPPALAAAVKNTRSAAENSQRSLLPLETRKVKDEITVELAVLLTSIWWYNSSCGRYRKCLFEVNIDYITRSASSFPTQRLI